MKLSAELPTVELIFLPAASKHSYSLPLDSVLLWRSYSDDFKFGNRIDFGTTDYKVNAATPYLAATAFA